MNFPVSVVGSGASTGASGEPGLGICPVAGEEACFGHDFQFGVSAFAEEGGPGDLSRAGASALGSKSISSWAETANGALPVPRANLFQSRWQAALDASVAARGAGRASRLTARALLPLPLGHCRGDCPQDFSEKNVSDVETTTKPI